MKKKQTCKKLLSLLLALVMASALAAPAFADEDGEHQDPAPLWFLWLDEDWESGDRELYLRDRDLGYSEYIELQAGWPSYGILGTGDCRRENGSFDISKFTPVDPKKVTVPSGVTINTDVIPRKGAKWGQYYFEINTTQRDKKLEVTSGDAVLTVDTCLPHLGVYTAPQASWNTWAGPYEFKYNPLQGSTWYIISPHTDEANGRHLVDLTLNSAPDNKLVDMTKVSDSVYKVELKPEALKRRDFHLEVDMSWTFEDNEPWTEEGRYIGDFNAWRPILASDTALMDATQPQTFPTYGSVKDKLSSSITMKAGVDTTAYLYSTWLIDPEEGQNLDWRVHYIPSDVQVFYSNSDDLTITRDEKDYSKFTFSASKPGTYGIFWGYKTLETIYHADGKPYTQAERDAFEEKILWNPNGGDLLVCDDWEFDEEAGDYILHSDYVAFEEMFPGESYKLSEPIDQGVFRLTVNVTPAEPTFTDVKTSDWFYNDVEWIAAQKTMGGTSPTTFEPYARVTREMVPTVLHRLAGSPAAGAPSGFTDVKSGWYQDAVNWAAGAKVVNGETSATFGVGKAITREELAVMLYRFAKDQNCDVSAKGDLSAFADQSSVSDWAKAELEWAVGAKIVNGSDGKLNPQGTATRAELAAMLARFCRDVL